MSYMTKRQALDFFQSTILPEIREACEKDGQVDTPARSEAWNNFTDALREDGEISTHQYNTWSNPY